MPILSEVKVRSRRIEFISARSNCKRLLEDGGDEKHDLPLRTNCKPSFRDQILTVTHSLSSNSTLAISKH
jgi:hypothetical protein